MNLVRIEVEIGRESGFGRKDRDGGVGLALGVVVGVYMRWWLVGWLSRSGIFLRRGRRDIFHRVELNVNECTIMRVVSHSVWRSRSSRVSEMVLCSLSMVGIGRLDCCL